MQNFVVQEQHQRAGTIDFSAGKDDLPDLILGSIGLFALAISAVQFMGQRSDLGDRAAPASAALPAERQDGWEQRRAAPSACPRDGMLAADMQLANRPEFVKGLTAHVGSTYKIPGPLAQKIVSTTLMVSRQNDMDPFLALGIIAKESSFNHKARSSYGATGLMQIHAPSHQALLGEIGIRHRDPKVVQQLLTTKVQLNVTAGVRIYKAYEKQYGSAVKALQAYNGAKQDTSYRYARKVLAMREDFKELAVKSMACA